MKALEDVSREGERPVVEMFRQPPIVYPSTAGSVEPCGKPGGPPPKAKYSCVTDSGQVP
jgi:hypothetical protein